MDSRGKGPSVRVTSQRERRIFAGVANSLFRSQEYHHQRNISYGRNDPKWYVVMILGTWLIRYNALFLVFGQSYLQS